MQKVLRFLARILTFAAVVLLTAAKSDLLAGLCCGACVLMAVLCGFLDDRIKRRDNQKQPVVTVDATVIAHSTTREKVGRHNYVTNYYIRFRTADGQCLEFQVSELDFEDFDIGETGPLRYRGWEFLSFGVQDKSGIQPMAPLPEEYDQPPAEKNSAVQRFAAWVKAKTAKTDQKSEKNVEGRPQVGILTHELDE